ncbi:hypothetical protein BN7_3379 [Wickerhamomyces ciferrii]|uniref:Uncharacterized protein n=1 Tax=Wickerhamomyces ciferrii (strain ATCC 14091 / BCRC 22168 / CBS 111 / JCM 3599 / NBRC 0793 / NRRL Y-1031 F-60-10) TaxID=1206466 RepID=K0KFD2_WICCF|nr:uncharacterized protein BN7_3379 [Wickerhamomyces ciferrii]CCH43825.1 hypothetical protein BN7_3379 [Wickerhamomyces ciferrii]
MDGNTTSRPSKRSKPSPQPFSKSQNEFNIKRNTQSNPINKEILRNFHNSTKSDQSNSKSKSKPNTPAKSPGFFRKNFVLQDNSNSPIINRTPISKVTPSKLKFQIYNDNQPSDQTPSKIPISTIKPDTIQSPVTQSPQAIEKISLKSLLEAASRDQSFRDPIPAVNADFTHNIGVLSHSEEGSLVHQAQLPFINLNNWMKITEHKILDPSNTVEKDEYLYSINYLELFNDHLIFAKCQKVHSDDEVVGDERKVFLLNHKQSIDDTVKINEKIQLGSKVLLFEGFNTPIGIKVYKNWKLLINIQN